MGAGALGAPTGDRTSGSAAGGGPADAIAGAGGTGADTVARISQLQAMIQQLARPVAS